MMYLLPTKSSIRYAGKRPNAIRHFSGQGTDMDGAKCVHIETNAGERYTISYDRLEPLLSYQGLLGKPFMDIVQNGTVITTMTQPMYDEWRDKLVKARAMAKMMREGARHG
jgi:hypothetical protein